MRKTSRSGEGWEEQTQKLRGSFALFKLYADYQELYYPKGSAVMPAFIATEAGIQQPVTSGQSMATCSADQQSTSTAGAIPTGTPTSNTPITYRTSTFKKRMSLKQRATERQGK